METTPTDNEIGPLAEKMKEWASRITLVSDEEGRAHDWKEYIVPILADGFFPPRFRQEITTWPHKKQKAVAAKVLELCTGQGAVIAMVGPRGIGKTTIAAQIAIKFAWAWIKWAHSTDPARVKPIGLASYFKLSEIVETLKPAYSDFGSVRDESITRKRDKLCSMGLLVIDEKHDADALKATTSVLTDIIDRRYATRRDTIIISNQKKEQFEATTSESVLSRLDEHGLIIECEWPSFRVKP